MKKLFVLIMSAALILGSYSAIAEESQTAVTAPVVYKADVQIPENDINYVSEYTLIANPKEYDGKKIRVVGKLKVNTGYSSLYVTSEAYDLGITKNALYCNINPHNLRTQYAKIKELDGKFVMIEGVFNGLNTGHTDYYSGAIENISLIKEWK